ncbi:GH92 family glycosyl hydrolase [Candidatus Solirubrobacter pratensis]|uniref:GH92 family glycosyl hydrolase n=1 Tax=Candidatus Solirubrobacter pratensis TaxID=1298857 RepID=UPI0003F7A2EC|nr:GH92 family glycosyl hydrolase [Candidatus Solirubrobacter pratensis]
MILAAPAVVEMPSAMAAGSLVTDPAQYVHTLAGTQGATNSFPGPAMPFGMVQFSPDTASGGNVQSTTGPTGAGYKYNQNYLIGFGATHASQGCGMGGDFPLLPTSYDNLTATSNTAAPWAQKLALSRTTYPETGEAGYYKVTARDTSTMSGTTAAGRLITSELSASTRGGIARFTFPADTPRPKVFLRTNQTAWSTSSYNSELTIDPATGVVTGRALVGNFCRKGEQHNIYYALRFEQPWADFGTWVNGQAAQAGRTHVSTSSNTQTGGYFTFPDGTQTITARMAVSYTSAANAQLNLDTELPNTRSFDDVRQANVAAWNADLSKVQVSTPAEGQSSDYLSTFYTGLYHSLTHPATFSDVNGDYLGFESTPKVHNVSESPGAGGRTRVQYSMFSDWDTYRNLVAFQSALFPDVASDVAQSLVNAAGQMGSFPRWTVANSSTDQMNGDSVGPLLASTWEFGARDWDVDKALDVMVDNIVGDKAGTFTGGTNTGAGGTNGMLNVRLPVMQRPGADYYNVFKYAPQVRPFQEDHMVTGASYTLEYSIDDFSVATLAAERGRTDIANQFFDRAQYWQNLWNPTANGIQPRDINGRYPDNADPNQQYPASFGYRGNVYDLGQQGFEEGNAEQYVWMVPDDLAGLITAMGGKDAAVQRLNTFLSKGLVQGASVGVPYMNLDNEPDFGVPWIFNYLGRPDRTTEVVDQITQSLFGYQPSGSEPGNDDLGALANFYVWAALGLYPESSGSSVVTFNAPMFDKSVVHLGNGHSLTINAEGAQTNRNYQAPDGHKYINQVAINGASTSKSWLDWRTLSKDTMIDVTLGSQPNTWGTADADLPPSWKDGSKPAALNVSTVGSPTSGAVVLQPGATGTAQLDVQRIGSTSDGFDVAVTTSNPGIVAAKVPSQSFDANGRAHVPLSFTVDPYLASGYYEATVKLTSGGASTSEKAILRVAKPGSLEAARTVTGTASYDALKGSFDGGSGVTWSGGNGTNMGDNTTTNTYDRKQLASVGLAPGAVKHFTAGDVPLTVIWPTAPVGFAEASQPAANQTITLERPSASFSLVGASYTGSTTIQASLQITDGDKVDTVTYPVAFSNWVLPSTVGNVQNGTLQPQYDNTVVAWMPHRLATETANDPGAYVFATKPYVAPKGWKVTSITFPTAGTGQRVFEVAGDSPAIQADDRVNAGGKIAVTGSGFAAGEPVTISLDSTPSATSVLEANALGEISGAVDVPHQLATGNYHVSASAASLPADAVEPQRVAITATETGAGTTVGGDVPATLALTLGAPASFGAFTPGVEQTYSAATTATVTSTAADATLSVSDPGHLTDGSFALPDALQVSMTPSAWTGPVSNGTSAIAFTQHIGAGDALRTGSYSRTLTFTLATTNP